MTISSNPNSGPVPWMAGLRLFRRTLAFLGAFLASAVCSSFAAETAAQISALQWLEKVDPTSPPSDDLVLKAAASPGRALGRMEDAPYQPFRAMWFTIRLNREQAPREPEFLRMNSLQRREIDAWLVVEGRVVARAAGGYARIAGIDAIQAGNFSLALANWEGREAVVVVRTVTTEGLPYRLAVARAEELRNDATLRSGFMLLFAGAGVVFIGFQLIFFASLRERAAVDYAVFCSLVVGTQLARSAILPFDFELGSLRTLPGDYVVELRLLSLLAGIWMAESFLDLRKSWLRLGYLNRVALMVAAVIGFGSLLWGVPAFHVAVPFCLILTTLWLLCVACLAAWQGRSGARYLLVGWLGLMVSVVYTNLSLVQAVPSTPLLQFVTPAGILWEMAFNAIGLLQKFAAVRAERHRAELHQAEVQGLTRLVRVVCHDVSNPLMVVQFCIERMKRQLAAGDSPAALVDPLRKAEWGGGAIAAVIEDVRALEVLRQSGGVLPVEEVDLVELARNSLLMFQERASTKGLIIEDRLPESGRAFATSGILVRSVFGNLLSNALKFSPRGGVIRLEMVRAPERIGVRISDAGSGVPAEVIAALQRSAAIKSHPGTLGESGTGFGLTLARDFTEAMGGSLQIEPRSVHAGLGASGTSVTVWLKEA
jgi:signal transduction histidine kinase